MERGWSAKGLLKPLWERLPGKREELAALTGIRGNTLSSYNSGKRQLGLANAKRIAEALDVSIGELGDPGVSRQPEADLERRLAALEETTVTLERHLQAARQGEELLLARVQELEVVVAALQGQRGALPMRSPQNRRPA